MSTVFFKSSALKKEAVQRERITIYGDLQEPSRDKKKKKR